MGSNPNCHNCHNYRQHSGYYGYLLQRKAPFFQCAKPQLMVLIVVL